MGIHLDGCITSTDKQRRMCKTLIVTAAKEHPIALERKVTVTVEIRTEAATLAGLSRDGFQSACLP